MTKRRKNRGQSPGGLPRRTWSAAAALDEVRRLNEHFLEVVVVLAVRGRNLSPFIVQHRALWVALDAAARARAARHSILLIDVDFQDEEAWRAVIQGRRGATQQPSAAAVLPAKRAQKLLRETLMLAWPLTRDNPAAARVLFGMSEAVAALIATLTPQQIDRMAERKGAVARPRWEDRPAFWGGLLQSALSGEVEALRKVHTHSLQLLGGELLPSYAKRGISSNTAAPKCAL